MADKWQLKAVISANAAGMLAALKSVDSASRATRKHLADVVKAGGNLGNRVGLPLAALGTVLSGLSVAAVARSVVGFTEFAEAIQKGALAAGVTAEQFQRLKFAGEQAGVGVEDLQSALAKLNVNIGQAAAGQNKDLAALFARLGISLRDANGQVRSGAELLPELSDAFERNGNAAVRARMGMAAFGKSYASMLPLLTEGGDSLRANMTEFDRLQGAIGASEIRAAKDLGDEFAKLRLVFTAVGATVSKELVPVIRPLIVSLTDWWAANKRLVSVQVGQMARDFGNWLKTIDFAAVLQGVSDFVKGMGRFVDMVGGAKNALLGFVVLINLQTLMALGSLVIALVKTGFAFSAMAIKAYAASSASVLAMLRIATVSIATAGWVGGISAAFATLGAVVMANPIGLTLAAIGAAAYLIYRNWDTLKSWFSSFFDWIADKFMTIVNWARELAGIASSLVGSTSVPGASAPVVRAPPGAALSALQSRAGGRVDGEIKISIDGAPAGTRVQQAGPKGIVPISVAVGYRSFATGAP